MTGPGTFWEHVVQASLPVFKICLLGCVGALLAACGVLDQHGRRTLSKLIYFVFTPALTFSKLAPVLTVQHLLLWMPLAVNMFLSVGVGLLLGVLLLLVVGAPPWFRKHVVVATALGNAGNLPLVLVAALLRESGGVIFENQDVSVDLAIAYVAMGIWAATLTHFTVGTHMLKTTGAKQGSSSSSNNNSSKGVGEYDALVSVEGGHQQDSSLKAASAEAAALEGSIAVHRSTLCDGVSFCSVELAANQASYTQQQQQELAQKAILPIAYDRHADSRSRQAVVPTQQQQQQQQQQGMGPGTSWQSLSAGVARFLQKPQSLWQQQQQQSFADLEHGERLRLLSSSQLSISGANPTSASANAHPQQQQHHRADVPLPGRSSRWCILKHQCYSAAVAVLDLLWAQASPPMVGCLLAVAVGMTRPVRDQLFTAGGHLRMIQDCIEMFSECCIPCLLLMMGATLAKGPGKACPPWRVVVGVCTARLVLLPLLGTGWILLAHRTGWLVAPDSMFLLVMLIQNAVPTALNVHTLATLHANREEEVGALLFWQYLTACLTVPAALMFFLWLLKTPALSVGGQ